MQLRVAFATLKMAALKLFATSIHCFWLALAIKFDENWNETSSFNSFIARTKTRKFTRIGKSVFCSAFANLFVVCLGHFWRHLRRHFRWIGAFVCCAFKRQTKQSKMKSNFGRKLQEKSTKKCLLIRAKSWYRNSRKATLKQPKKRLRIKAAPKSEIAASSFRLFLGLVARCEIS